MRNMIFFVHTTYVLSLLCIHFTRGANRHPSAIIKTYGS